MATNRVVSIAEDARNTAFPWQPGLRAKAPVGDGMVVHGVVIHGRETAVAGGHGMPGRAVAKSSGENVAKMIDSAMFSAPPS